MPQGAVSSSLLFTLNTNGCRSVSPNTKILKFFDDTIILSLLSVGESPSMYFRQTDSFQSWCEEHHLTLNVVKTKEKIFDPKGLLPHDPVIIGGREIEQVRSFKYLGVYVDNLLKWNVHVDFLCKKKTVSETPLSQEIETVRCKQ